MSLPYITFLPSSFPHFVILTWAARVCVR
jgi:hypothetical protein